MPRRALVLIVAPLALCVGCAAFGYLVAWPRVKTAVSERQAAVADEMAEAVFQSVSRRIAASERAADRPRSNELVLRAADLNVNNADVPGEVGIETGTFGSTIYGVATEIRPTGISLLLPGVTYSGVPVVEDGRVEFTQVEAGDDLLGFVLSAEMFEESMEEGINRALEAHGLTPISITLRHGSMTILTEPAACSEASDACPTATIADHRDTASGSRNRLQRDPGSLRSGFAGQAATRMPRHLVRSDLRSPAMTISVEEQLRHELASGERLLWSGRPSGNLRVGFGFWGPTVFLLLWTGGVDGVAFNEVAERGLFSSALFPTAMTLVGLSMLVFVAVVVPRLMSQTLYGLTDRGAIIVEDPFGRTVESLPLDGMTNVVLRERGDRRGTIAFKDFTRPCGEDSECVPEFALIEDAPLVYELIRDVKANQPALWP